MVKLRATPENWQIIMDQTKQILSVTKDPQVRKSLMDNFRTAQSFATAKPPKEPTNKELRGVLSKPRPPRVAAKGL